MYIYGFILILYFTTVEGTERYFVTSSLSTWNIAINRSDCDIATPISVPGENELPYNISGQVWVGYYGTKVLFEYLGCRPLGPLGESYVLHTDNLVGMCYSLCRRKSYQTVGVTSNKCFCIDVENIDSFDCNIPEAETMDVYKAYLQEHSFTKVDKESLCKETPRDCLKIERYDGTTYPTWSNCECHFQTVCLPANEVLVKAEGETWNISARTSLKECGSALSVDAISKITTSDAIFPSWSGVIRRFVIFRYDDKYLEAHRKIKYGFLKTTTTRVELVFKNNQSELLPVLCKIESTTSATPVTSTFLTTFSSASVTPGSSPSSTTTISSASVIPGSSPSSTTTISSASVTPGSSPSSTITSVVVGVVVSVIAVLLVVVVLVLVYLRRRHNLPDFCKWATKAKTGDDYQQNVTYSSDNPNRQPARGFSNQAYNQVLPKPEENKTSGDYKSYDSAHDYAAIEPQKLGNGRPNIGAYDNDVLEIAESNDNVYNELKAESDSAYDHAEKTKLDFKTDNDYDTSATAVEKLKAIKGFDENADDTYNHINAKPEISGHTDNIYGLAGRYRDENMATKDDMDDNDDYSHINKKPERDCMPDAVYNTISKTNVHDNS